MSSLSTCFLYAILVFFTFESSAYVIFDSKPVENWDEIIEKSSVQRTYEVQKGDTLYDISKTLFGDPKFWPKIWSFNSKLTNPHLISKGEVIYFSGGTLNQIPEIKMGKIRGEVSKYVFGSGFLSPEIPPAQVYKGPIEIPSSLPDFYTAPDKALEQSQLSSMSIGRRAVYDQNAVVPILRQIVSSPPRKEGHIIRVQSGGQAAREGEFVVVQMNEGASVGTRYNVFNGGLKKKSVNFGIKRIHIIEWEGQIEIVKSLKEREYLAKVIKSYTLFNLKSEITSEGFSYVRLPKDKSFQVSQPSQVVEVVGSEVAFDTKAIGERSIVYLNRGTSAGLVEGSIYPIYGNFGIGIRRTKKTRFIPEPIGYIKIATVESGLATGVAFNLLREVSSEDRIGLYAN